MVAPCQCEHVDHFMPEEIPVPPPGHAYGHECDLENMTRVVTPYGVFTVCVDCARTHLARFAR